MNVDQWLRNKGIVVEDETDDRRSRIRPENVRYEKPIVDPVADAEGGDGSGLTRQLAG